MQAQETNCALPARQYAKGGQWSWSLRAVSFLYKFCKKKPGAGYNPYLVMRIAVAGKPSSLWLRIKIFNLKAPIQCGAFCLLLFRSSGQIKSLPFFNFYIKMYSFESRVLIKKYKILKLAHRIVIRSGENHKFKPVIKPFSWRIFCSLRQVALFGRL